MQDTCTAESPVITVEQLTVDAFLPHGNGVIPPHRTRKIHRKYNGIAVRRVPLEHKHVVVTAVRRCPAEALPGTVQLPERRRSKIKAVKRADKIPQLGMHLIIQHKPLERGRVVPLAELPELTPHKQ